MSVIIGLVFVVMAVAAFVYSLPRGDRRAIFVGTEWEAYAVVAMIGLLAAGLVMTVVGIAEWAE